jgi:glutamate-1-semialdehyde 2,1-aminomutase
MPWLALSYRHREEEFALTEKALRATFEVYRKALRDGAETYLLGPVLKPVFRKFN